MPRKRAEIYRHAKAERDRAIRAGFPAWAYDARGISDYARGVVRATRSLVFDSVLMGLDEYECALVPILRGLPDSNMFWGLIGYSLIMQSIGESVARDGGVDGSAGVRNLVIGCQSAMLWCQRAGFTSYAVDDALAAQFMMSGLGGATLGELNLPTDPLAVIVAADRSPLIATDLEGNEISLWIVMLGTLDTPSWGRVLYDGFNRLIRLASMGAMRGRICQAANALARRVARAKAKVEAEDPMGENERMVYVAATGGGISLSFNEKVDPQIRLADLEKKCLASKDLGDVDSRAVAAAFRLAVGVAMTASIRDPKRRSIPKPSRKAIRAARLTGDHYTGELPMFDLRNIVDFARADAERIVNIAQDECRVGRRKKHVKISRHLVRGHWRMQPCGPRRSERRPTWISAHWRGGGEFAPGKIYKLEARDGQEEK